MRTQRMLWPIKVLRWDLMVYHCVGCWDHTLLQYTIWSLQGYSGELVWNSRMDITLDDVLMFLDEHYNNVKVLDALNQELFQLQMADKETVSDWGICLSRHLQALAASFPDHFPPDCVTELKWDHFHGRLPKRLKAMVSYLKAIPHRKTYSDYLWAVREAEKEDPWSYPKIHAARQLITLLSQKLLVSSLCRSSNGTSQYLKWPPCTWHTWKRKALRERRKTKLRTLMVSMGLWKSSWCAWHRP